MSRRSLRSVRTLLRDAANETVIDDPEATQALESPDRASWDAVLKSFRMG